MTAEQFSARARLVRALLAERKLNGFIVSSLANVRYLTGFAGSNGLLLLAGDDLVLFTDPRYKFQAARQAGCTVRVVPGPLLPAVTDFLQNKGIRKLAFERTQIDFASYELLKASSPPRTSLVPLDGLVESLRMVKSEEEINLIRRSAITCAKAFRDSLKFLRPGVRESDVAARLEFQMRRLGAERAAFETIVAAGERSALPHAQPTSNTLANNQLLLIDVGASQDGYASDMTRMAFLGRPGAKIRRLYNAVLNAQLAAIASVRPGVTAEQVDRQARRVLRAEKLDAAFLHSTGHGLGLEIHEPPRLGRRDKTRLAAGMAITVEPGVYLQGLGGIRIEDTVVVTRQGCEVLTPASKELILL